MLIELFNEGSLSNVQSLNVEPSYGYAGQLLYKNGAVRYYKNSCLGINNLGAAEIAKDKGYAKYFLDSLGYSTPKGKVYLLPFFLDEIKKSSKKYQHQCFDTIDDLPDYIEKELSYPCFIKPNDESQGRGASKCTCRNDLNDIIDEYQRSKIKLLLVEEFICFPDYRIVVFNNKIISCYLRKPLSVTGDGTTTIAQLLHNKQESFLAQERSTKINIQDKRIIKNLSRKQMTLETIPKINEVVILQDVSNLSAGGTAVDCSINIHKYWQDLSIRITKDMGLILCGVDLACSDIENPNGTYSVLEINAAPGLDNYAATGNEQRLAVKKLYQEIVNANL
jgi:D-alanine-D-alanine ligase-like ATP-grasp enzyme